MTLPQFAVTPDQLTQVDVGDVVVLTGPEARHAATVRRIGVGERVRLADGRGRVAVVRAEAVGPVRLDTRVERLVDEPQLDPRLVLVQALAKGDRDLSAVEAATELGVDHVIPWQADRSIVRWRGDRATKALTKWQSVAAAASKQSRRAWTPTVGPCVSSTGLAELVTRASAAYLLHESADDALAGTSMPSGGQVLIIVGPEGGISDGELDALTGAGGRVVRLGPQVLRASTAGPAALAVLSARQRWR